MAQFPFPEDIVANHIGTRLLRELEAGPGPARNFGVRSAIGDIIAFIDADCRAHRDWLRNALQTIRSSPEGTILGGDVRIWRNRWNTFTEIKAFEPFLNTVSNFLSNDMATAEPGTWSFGVRTMKRLGRLQKSSLPKMSNGDSAPAPQDSHSVTFRRWLFFIRRVARYRNCVRNGTAIRNTSSIWRVGSINGGFSRIARAVAVLASPIVHSMKVLASDRIQGVSARLKAISVLFAIVPIALAKCSVF